MQIVITGTTSGIGAALALYYAQPGVTLGLIGRRQERLHATAEQCTARGAMVIPVVMDVRDAGAMQTYATQFVRQAGGIDMVIANAGIGHSDALESGNATYHTEVFEVNVLGLLNTLLPFIPAMIQQRHGQLVAIASVAGFRALPGSTTYAATKIAIRTLMEGYGWALRQYGITTTTINPGFVVSEMTVRNQFHMPFLLSTEAAVHKMANAIRQQRRSYTFPWPMALVAHLLPYIPSSILGRLKPPSAAANESDDT